MRSLSKVQVAGLLAGACLVALAVAIWTLLLSPRVATAQELKVQSEQVESANIALVKQHQEILALGAQAPQLANEAQRLFSRMPQSAQLPDVLRQINAAAVHAGINPRNVQLLNATIPEQVDDKTDPALSGPATQAVDLGLHLATMDVQVTVTGTDAQRLAFLKLLQGLDRGLLITGTSAVTDGANANAGTLSVTGTMFVLESQLPNLVTTAQEVIAKARQEATDSTTAS